MLPNAPVENLVNVGFEHNITLFMGVLAIACFAFALLNWKTTGKPIVMLLFLAGGGMFIMEPMVDTVGGCWFPVNSTIVYHAYGRPLPLWVGLNYFDYFGIGGGLIWLAMRRGITRLQLFLIFIAAMVTDIVLEEVNLSYDLYTYYGAQPLVLNKFPLWWAPVNALVVVVAAAVAFWIEQVVSGWKLLVIIPALVSASAAANAAAGWPAWIVINSNYGPLLTQLGGVAAFVFAFGIIYLVGATLGLAQPAARARLAHS